MTLFELVTLKETLISQLNTSRVQAEISTLTSNLTAIKVKIGPGLYGEILKPAIVHLNKLLANTISTETHLNELIAAIDNEIEGLTTHMLTEGYGKAFDVDYATYKEQRCSAIPEEHMAAIEGRIVKYASWKYPALEIGPMNQSLTSMLVGCDPLYLADVYSESIATAKQPFTSQFQDRICAYQIGDKISEMSLSALPSEQFGFVLLWNRLNYLTLDTIEKLLLEVIETMRPGGVCMFSYNDGDRSVCIPDVMSKRMTYVPKSKLEALCKKIGFEIVDTYGVSNKISWIEIRKPGKLTSVKAHQTLGKILDILA